MSDPEPDLPPQDEARLRRLLREARHDVAIPEAVAARLDWVLLHLADDPARLTTAEDPADDPADDPGGDRAGDPPTRVTSRPAAAHGPVAVAGDLSGRRRRRTAGRLLLAAAAVVVSGGVGVAIEHHGTAPETVSDASARPTASAASDGADDRPDAGSPTARAGSTGTAPNPRAAHSDDNGVGADPPASLASLSGARDDLPQLASATFARQVERLRARLPASSTSTRSRRQALRACLVPDAGAGRRVPVVYAGTAALLVLRPAHGSTQVVDLLACGSSTELRSVTLRVR